MNISPRVVQYTFILFNFLVQSANYLGERATAGQCRLQQWLGESYHIVLFNCIQQIYRKILRLPLGSHFARGPHDDLL